MEQQEISIDEMIVLLHILKRHYNCTLFLK